MSLKCANCYALRIRLVTNVVQSCYCVLTGNDVRPHNLACKEYEEAKTVWKRDKRERR